MTDLLEIILNYYFSEATLTVNLTKSEFGHAKLTFLGQMVGQGQVKPVEAKVEAISDFPVPSGKRQLMCFLGMAGYYKKFCNYSCVIAEPLTNLLGKRVKFIGLSIVRILLKSFRPYLKVLQFSMHQAVTKNLSWL